jgi:hypothetical protein
MIMKNILLSIVLVAASTAVFAQSSATPNVATNVVANQPSAPVVAAKEKLAQDKAALHADHQKGRALHEKVEADKAGGNVAAVEADKAAAKDLKAKVQSERAVVKTDREQLHAARKDAHQAHQAGK